MRSPTRISLPPSMVGASSLTCQALASLWSSSLTMVRLRATSRVSSAASSKTRAPHAATLLTARPLACSSLQEGGSTGGRSFEHDTEARGDSKRCYKRGS
jgi:hypothetical protein